MKLLTALLAASLVANAALLLPLVLREVSRVSSADAAPVTDSTGRNTPANSANPGVRPARPATGDGRAITEAIRSDDLESLRDELRAAGLPEDTVRSIVSTRIWKRHEARFRALNTKPSDQTEWWKNDTGWGNYSKVQREQMRDIQAEIKAENLRLLGPDPDTTRGNNPWFERQYGYLPPDKREALQQIEQDYNDLSSELRQETQGFETAADREKARFIEEEKLRDLAALLSPEEFKAHELRNSSTAQQLRWRMTTMDATEREYLAVFELQKKFDEAFNQTDGFGNRVRNENTEDGNLRQEGEKALRAQLKATLGEERYQAYVFSDNHDFRQLQSAVKRFNLPPESATRTLALRQEVPSAANRVLDNPEFSIEDKKAALAKLAADARDQIRTNLGSEVAETLFAGGSMNWISNLEQGSVVSYDEDGNQLYRHVNETRPKNKKP